MKENDFEVKLEHSDIMGQKAINAIYCGQPEEHVICPNCGETANLDPEVLTSMPPQRRIRCPHCGYVGSEFCHNLQVFYDTPNKPWAFGAIKSENLISYTKCIICGDSVAFNMTAQEPSAHVCDNCKKAILKLRKMLEDNND